MLDWLKEKLNALATWLGELFAATLGWLWDGVIEVILALSDVIADAICWTFESVLDVVIDAVGWAMECCGLGGLGAYSSTFGSMPSEILNIMGLIGFGECVTILICGWSIRMALQLIPFVRLGS